MIVSSFSITPFVDASESTDSSYFAVDETTAPGWLFSYSGTDTDVVLPSVINGIQMTDVYGTFSYNTLVTSVVVSEGYVALQNSPFRNCTSLRYVSLPSTLESIGSNSFRSCTVLETVNVPEKVKSIPSYAFQDCTNPNLVINIQSLQIASAPVSAFKNVVGTIKVYSQEMYDLISPKAATANVVLVSSTDPTNPPTPSLDYTSLDNALADGEAVDTSKYTEATVATLTEALALGKAVKDNASATQEDVDNAAQAIRNAIDGLAVKVDYTALNAAIATAEDIIANHSDEYTAESLAQLQWSLDFAKPYQGKDTNQATIDSVTASLVYALENSLVKVDIDKMLADLKAVIEEAAANDSSDYTDESYQVLADAIEAANKMNADSSYQDILDAQSNIENAVKALILRPLEEFVKVYKNGEVATLAKGTADSEMAGATSVRVTFNCAPDVSYNEYASLELKAVIAGTESYEKFAGKGDYTAGTNGWTETLALTNAIAEGQSYELTAFTYSWSNASDYVYAVSKIEFLDAEGNVRSKITANTQAFAELQKAISDAEAIDTSKYTVESVAVLTSEVGVAKAVTDKAAVAEITAATEAIKAAIEGLEPVVNTGSITGTIKVSDEEDSTEMTVVVISADGTETSVRAASMGEYKIEGLAVGEYKLTVSGGKYAARTYEVTVEEGGITQDVELNPYGDINGDGEVTTADVGKANSHAKRVTELTGYEFVCADVSKDGSITTLDVGMINSHAKGVKALW